ncbi:N-terminal domain of NEFA-interacting nuclear protein NIP30-domain-containing protein [Lipomyces oligophaga]|uniref:N-terminal domain of NEFA-interacting nuclear protein NIP30-domain-containing protein n=1 Tax=Lipomyces oligophaga TaxID=45792 RepID=UPI0034CF370D
MSSGFTSGSGAISKSTARAGLGSQAQVNLTQSDRSLYDILQANKDRKQLEFEQETAARNQIHRLDEDEVAFLQSLADKEKRQQDRVNKEVEDSLKLFRELKRAKENKHLEMIETLETVEPAEPAETKENKPMPSFDISAFKSRFVSSKDTFHDSEKESIGTENISAVQGLVTKSDEVSESKSTDHKRNATPPDPKSKKAALNRILARRNEKKISKSLSGVIVRKKK